MPHNHIDDLRRAANANLVALRNGDVKRQQERDRAARKAGAALRREAATYKRQEERDRKAEIKRLRERLEEIECIWESVELDFPESLQRGAFEELDSERDRICERIHKLESYY